ncbi:hypothetical protein FRC16_001843 [Serendipita sp. 398]|nr:hypothetical protein FRC16_001843 [Serendipita sp. 398]
MIFVERVSHITAQVEYGLIPADPKSRKYDEQGFLLGNEGMELLSPKVYEDTPRGAFFFAERRPTAKPSAKPEQGKKSTGQKPGERKEKKNEEKGEKDLPGIPAVIPTLLDQLVKLRVLRIIPNIRCRSIQHSGACLVRILLSDSEVSLLTECSPVLDLTIMRRPLLPRSDTLVLAHDIPTYCTKRQIIHASRSARPVEPYQTATGCTIVVNRVFPQTGPFIG